MILKDRCQPEPAMKLRTSVASVISEHVAFELESIDRVYLNVYIPRLQREGGVAAFFRFHHGHLFASSVKASVRTTLQPNISRSSKAKKLNLAEPCCLKT